MTNTQKQICGQSERCMKKAIQAIKQMRFYYAAGKKNKIRMSEIPQKYQRKFKYWQRYANLHSLKFAEYQNAYRATLSDY